MNKFVRFILFVCLALSFYSTFLLVGLNMNDERVSMFFSPETNRKFLLFIASNGISLIIGWGPGMAVHHDENDKVVRYVKKESQNLARYAYYTSIVMIIVVLVAIIDVIFK